MIALPTQRKVPAPLPLKVAKAAYGALVPLLATLALKNPTPRASRHRSSSVIYMHLESSLLSVLLTRVRETVCRPLRVESPARGAQVAPSVTRAISTLMQRLFLRRSSDVSIRHGTRLCSLLPSTTWVSN